MLRISQLSAAGALCLAAMNVNAQTGLATGLGALLEGMEQGRRGQVAPPSHQAPSLNYQSRQEALWTGQQRQVELVSGGYGFSCEYQLYGRTFWRAFREPCPSSVPVN